MTITLLVAHRLTLVIVYAFSPGFPLRLENLEKWGRHFPVREKSGNFEQTGKVRENHTKYWKTLGI